MCVPDGTVFWLSGLLLAAPQSRAAVSPQLGSSDNTGEQYLPKSTSVSLIQQPVLEMTWRHPSMLQIRHWSGTAYINSVVFLEVQGSINFW